MACSPAEALAGGCVGAAAGRSRRGSPWEEQERRARRQRYLPEHALGRRSGGPGAACSLAEALAGGCAVAAAERSRRRSPGEEQGRRARRRMRWGGSWGRKDGDALAGKELGRRRTRMHQAFNIDASMLARLND